MAQSSTNPKPYQRKVRVAALIQRTLGMHLATKSLDPTLRQLTITRVDCSPDLKQAKIFLSCEGHDEPQRTLSHLKATTYHLRHYLAKHLPLRIAPKLVFCFEEKLADLNKINGLLDQIAVSNPGE
jgi:ribosome-binding factor A